MKEGWEYKTLGEITTSINGLWKGKKEPFVNIGVIRNANFTKEITLDFSNIVYLDVEEKQFKARQLQKGDLIVEKSGGSEKQPVGRTVLFNEESGSFSVSNFTSILRINKQSEIIPEFLYKYLLYIYREGKTKEMQNAATGIHNIIYDKFLSIQVPIPPLPEQHRIVEYLDTQFAKIDALKTNAEQQLQAAKDLFQAALKELLTPKEGWVEKKLGEVAKSMADGPFGSNLKAQHYTTKKEVRIVQLSNIGEFGWKEENVKYTSFEHLKTISRSEVHCGDIVIAKMMPAGRAIICPNNEAKYVLSSDAVKVELKDGYSPDFIMYSINSNWFNKQVLANVTGSGRIRTSLTKLRDCNLYIPDIETQKGVVEELNMAYMKTKALQTNYTETITLCNDLKQALLKKVFEEDG